MTLKILATTLGLAAVLAAAAPAPVLATGNCVDALGMIETAELADGTGNRGNAWIKTKRGAYSGKLIGTVTARDANGFPSSLSYRFITPRGTVQMTGDILDSRFALLLPDRYVTGLLVTVADDQRLAGRPITGVFLVDLAVNFAKNDERGVLSGGLICH
jgi:hypothetical protein